VRDPLRWRQRLRRFFFAGTGVVLPNHASTIVFVAFVVAVFA